MIIGTFVAILSRRSIARRSHRSRRWAIMRGRLLLGIIPRSSDKLADGVDRMSETASRNLETARLRLRGGFLAIGPRLADFPYPYHHQDRVWLLTGRSTAWKTQTALCTAMPWRQTAFCERCQTLPAGSPPAATAIPPIAEDRQPMVRFRRFSSAGPPAADEKEAWR